MAVVGSGCHLGAVEIEEAKICNLSDALACGSFIIGGDAELAVTVERRAGRIWRRRE